MKTSKLIIGLVLVLSAWSLVINYSSCTKDEEIAPVAPYEYGEDVINTTEWELDMSHSGVRFETAYLGDGALFSGRFNEFNVDINFDEANPAKTTIAGSVNLYSINTGEPGRDEGCLIGTLGMESNSEATFSSTLVEFDNEGGYIVTGNMEFHGVTSSATMHLVYNGTTFYDENSGVYGAPFYLAGFTATLDMQAKAVYGVETTNISDLVKVIMDINLEK
jgi:polyisoprenoid-binding protein YceI